MINLQRVGFYYIASEDVAIVENAILEADKAGWSIAWNIDQLDNIVMVDLCIMYAIPNNTDVITNLLVRGRPYYVVLVDGTGKLTDLEAPIVSCIINLGCSIKWCKIYCSLNGVVNDRVVALASTSVYCYNFLFLCLQLTGSLPLSPGTSLPDFPRETESPLELNKFIFGLKTSTT